MPTIKIQTGEQVEIDMQPQDCTEEQWQILSALAASSPIPDN